MSNTLLYIIAGVVMAIMFGVMIFYHPKPKDN